MKTVAILTTCVGAAIAHLQPSECKALALSGDGDRMAWVAGAVKGLVERLTDRERQWQIVTGMSSGSILASIAGSHWIGDELLMVESMVHDVLKFTNTPGPAHVSANWSSGVVPANQSGLLNSSILQSTLRDVFESKRLSDRKFNLAATDDATGSLALWDESSMRGSFGVTDYERWVDYIRASMSSPGIDQTVDIQGTVYSTGSIVLGVDVFSAILRCKEAGYEEKDIIVDVVTGSSLALGPWDPAIDDVTLKLAQRGQEIKAFTTQMQDVSDACDAYPDVQWRYLVSAPADLPSDGSSYNAIQMEDMVARGIASAKNSTTGQHCSIANSFRRSQRSPPRDPEQWVNKAPKCRVLALSGGGAFGAYEAGVIKGLVQRLSPEERQWKVVTGLSAGSILTSGTALFNLGEEVEMTEFVIESMMNFTNVNSTVGNVYIDWSNASMELTESGFEDTEPLFNTLKKMLAPKQLGNRKFVVGGTEDATGEVRLWDEKSVLNSDGTFNSTKLAVFVRASAAIPGIFQSVTIDGKVYSDGTLPMGVDIFTGINRCKAAGYAEGNIVVDAVTTDKSRLSPWDPATQHAAAEVKARAGAISSFTSTMADILDACQAFPDVDWRYYVQAPKDLPGNQASFDEPTMQLMLQAGLNQTATAMTGTQCALAQKYRKSNVLKTARMQLITV